MTELLDQAFAAVKRMPPTTRASMARAILAIADGVAVDEIEPEHLPFVLEGLAEIERGDLASEDEVDRAFRTFEA